MAVADVGDTSGVEGRAALERAGGCGGGGGGGSWGGGGGARDEAAAGLACLGLCADARADTRGTRAATRRAVGGAEALAADELATVAVANVLDTGGVEGGAAVGLRRGDGRDHEDDCGVEERRSADSSDNGAGERDWMRLTVEESGESEDGLHCGNVKVRVGFAPKASRKCRECGEHRAQGSGWEKMNVRQGPGESLDEKLKLLYASSAAISRSELAGWGRVGGRIDKLRTDREDRAPYPTPSPSGTETKQI